MRQDTDTITDQQAVIEWAPFRLVSGVETETLLEAADTIQREFLEHQPGFVRRELLRGADGQWVDLLVWKDEPSAMAAMSAAASSPTCRAYFHLMVGGDNLEADGGVLHLQRVRAYESR